MLKALILFTNYYPFYKGEEYLETEIVTTIKYFDKVLVIPTMVRNNMVPTRSLPEKVELLVPDVDCSIIGKIKMTLKNGVKTLNYYQNNAKNQRTYVQVLLQKMYSIYFMARVREVLIKLKKYDFSAFESYDVTIYSYWMHVVASIGLRFRDDVFGNKDVKLVCRGHRYDIYENLNYINYIPDRKNLLNRYDKIFPCSQFGVNYLTRRYPGYEEKILLSRLGSSDAGIAQCNLGEPYLFLSCSSTNKVKRISVIIDLLKKLHDNGYNVSWSHFGDGPDLERIKKYAALELRGVEFIFHGQVTNQRLKEYYGRCRPFAFINVSSSEGVPVSIMEALSFGIPVIATDVGGTHELVIDSVNGYLVNGECKIDELVSITKKMMLLDQNAYNMLCMNARQSWEEKANSELLYNEFYKHLTIEYSI